MTKKELATALVAESEDIETKVVATRIIDSLFNVIKNTLVSKDIVDISNFGKFATKEQPSRTGLIPGKQKKYTTKPCTVPTFKFSSKLKETVKTGK